MGSVTMRFPSPRRTMVGDDRHRRGARAVDTEQSDPAARRHHTPTAGAARPSPSIPPQVSRLRHVPQSHLSRGLDDFDDNHLVRGYD